MENHNSKQYLTFTSAFKVKTKNLNIASNKEKQNQFTRPPQFNGGKSISLPKQAEGSPTVKTSTGTQEVKLNRLKYSNKHPILKQ